MSINKYIFLILIIQAVYVAKVVAQGAPDYDKIIELLEDHNYRQAYSLSVSFSKLYPKNCHVSVFKGISEYQLQKYDSAIVQLQHSMELCRSDKQFKEQRNLIYLFLAKSYHAKGEYSEALTYLNYLDRRGARKNQLKTETSLLRTYCKNAMQLTAHPIEANIVPLLALNSVSDETNPLVLSDESAIYFSSNRPGSMGGRIASDGKFYNDIYISYRDNSQWNSPLRCDENFNSSAHEATSGINSDENVVFVTRNVENHFDIFAISTNKMGSTTSVLSNAEINTNTNENDLTISPDGKLVIFSSDRKGTLGGYDLFYMQQQPNGTWTEPKNMGSLINTPHDEVSPCLHSNGNLYFCSQGHTSIGGFDIFIARADGEGGWFEPDNIGYPVNTSVDEEGVWVAANPSHIYMSRMVNGNFDLYRVDIKGMETNSFCFVRGVVANMDSSLIVDKLVLLDQNQSQLSTFSINKDNGKFLLNVLPDKDYSFSLYANTKVIETRKLKISRKEVTDSTDFAVFYLDTIFIRPEKVMVENETLVSNTDSLFTNDSIATIPENEIYIGYSEMVNTHANNLSDQMAQHLYLTKFYDEWYGKWYESMNMDTRNFLLKDVYFSKNSYDITSSLPELIKIAHLLKSDSLSRLYIVGHTDEDGDSIYNKRLSEKRCDAVRKSLINGGVSESKLICIAQGANMPFIKRSSENNNDSVQLLSYNRRVEFFIETFEGVHTYAIVPEVPPEHINPVYLKDSLTSDYKVVFLAKNSGHSLPGMVISKSDDKFLISANVLSYPLAYEMINEIKNKYDGIPFIVRAMNMRGVQADQNLYYSVYLAASEVLLPDAKFSGITDVKRILNDAGLYLYFYGQFSNLEKAEEARVWAQEHGFKFAFIFINNYLEN